MELNEFLATLQEPKPPKGLSVELQALWFAAAGNWQRAHELVQDHTTRDAAWVHAYLHREEGDSENAAYWYQRARKAVATVDLKKEWQNIAAELLSGVS